MLLIIIHIPAIIGIIDMNNALLHKIITPLIASNIPSINSLLNALISASSAMYDIILIIPSTINITPNIVTTVDNTVSGFAIKNIYTIISNIEISIDCFSYFFK